MFLHQLAYVNYSVPRTTAESNADAQFYLTEVVITMMTNNHFLEMRKHRASCFAANSIKLTTPYLKSGQHAAGRLAFTGEALELKSTFLRIRQSKERSASGHPLVLKCIL